MFSRLLSSWAGNRQGLVIPVEKSGCAETYFPLNRAFGAIMVWIIQEGPSEGLAHGERDNRREHPGLAWLSSASPSGTTVPWDYGGLLVYRIRDKYWLAGRHNKKKKKNQKKHTKQTTQKKSDERPRSGAGASARPGASSPTAVAACDVPSRWLPRLIAAESPHVVHADDLFGLGLPLDRLACGGPPRWSECV